MCCVSCVMLWIVRLVSCWNTILNKCDIIMLVEKGEQKMNKIEYYHRFFELVANVDEAYIVCPKCQNRIDFKFDLKQMLVGFGLNFSQPSYRNNETYMYKCCSEINEIPFIDFENAKKKYTNEFIDKMTIKDYWDTDLITFVNKK